MLRNKCYYSSYCLLNSFFHHILPHWTWHISQNMSGTPMSVPCQYPMRLFGIGVTCNDRIALIVFSKWLSFTGSWTWEHPFFTFYGKDGEDRTRGLTVHNLTSCLRPHCEEVDWKYYATNATRVIALWTRFSTRVHHCVLGFVKPADHT